MAVTKVIEAKAELWPVRIFLDDLFEIENMIVEAYKKKGVEEIPTFVYRIGNLRLTTHDDLLEHGGFSKKFCLQAENGSLYLRSLSLDVLNIGGLLEPRFSAPFDVTDDWELIRKVELLFQSRATLFQRLLALAPQPFRFAFSASLSVVLPIGVFGAILIDVHKHDKQSEHFLVVAICVCLLWCCAFILARRNTPGIYLINSRAKQKEIAARRLDFRQKLLWAVLGSLPGLILGALLKSIMDHLQHK